MHVAMTFRGSFISAVIPQRKACCEANATTGLSLATANDDNSSHCVSQQNPTM